jgi:hypothetical protein
MPSSLISAYVDFDIATDYMHQSLNDGRMAVEQISLRNSSLRRVFSGKDAKKVVQNGKMIKGYVQVEDKNTAHYFGAGAVLNVSNVQLLKEVYTPWAMVRDAYVLDNEELDLHEGNTAERFVNIKMNQERAIYIEKCRFLEKNGCWATPNAETMEAATLSPGTERAITPWNVLVNEEANAVPTQYSKTGGYSGGTAYNTVQQLSRVTYPAWRCQQKSYIGGPQAAVTADTLMSGLSHMSRACNFTGLPIGDGPYINKSSMPAVIWCSPDGYTALEQDMMQRQNYVVWLGKQDPTFPSITVHGIPVEEIVTIGTANIFPTGASGVYSTERDISNAVALGNAGPRYFFMDFSEHGLGMIVHSEKFFFKQPAAMPNMQLNRRVFAYDSYLNTNAVSCRSSGIVYPAADISGFTN